MRSLGLVDWDDGKAQSLRILGEKTLAEWREAALQYKQEAEQWREYALSLQPRSPEQPSRYE